MKKMKVKSVIENARRAMAGPEITPFPIEWEQRFTIEQLERLAIRAICGQMSDDQALAAENLA